MYTNVHTHRGVCPNKNLRRLNTHEKGKPYDTWELLLTLLLEQVWKIALIRSSGFSEMPSIWQCGSKFTKTCLGRNLALRARARAVSVCAFFLHL